MPLPGTFPIPILILDAFCTFISFTHCGSTVPRGSGVLMLPKPHTTASSSTIPEGFFGEKVLCREHSQGLGGLLWREPRSHRLGVQAEPEGHWRVAALGCHLRLNADIPAAWKYA